MDELLPPKRKKISPRAMRKLEREAMGEAEKVRQYVESRGGQDAFEREMQAVARKYGGRYGLPRVSPKKEFVAGRYFEAESPLKELTALGSAIPVPGGLLLLPEGSAKATVKIPPKFRKAFTIKPHSTSTFARLGINILHYASDYLQQLRRKQLPSKLEVVLHNWSSLPVLVREGDPCRLLNFSEILGAGAEPVATAPRTKQAHRMAELHAGNNLIKINLDKLPRARFGNDEIPYVDPRAKNLKQVFESHSFQKLEVKPGDFIVISTKERMRVPADNVALVHSARDDLAHTSAVLAHAGWEGILALEFKAFHKATIRPGDHLAYLTAHAPQQLELPLYRGRYQSQETAEPKPKEVKK
ncbi:hypothetical protein H0O03_03155 [Candidatus Micrarchaeota archaeon]|nr:hypothetical protein [Candidatus Micrarchaeota archaeon]